MPIIIDPHPVKFWCVSKPPDTTQQCVSTAGTSADLVRLGYRIVSGPYDTQALCQAVCVPPPPPIPLWYCVIKPPGTPKQCISSTLSIYQLQLAGYDVQGGPYQTQSLCLSACVPPPPPPSTYWCVIAPGTTTRSCFFTPLTSSQLTTSGYSVQGGPYDTQTLCQAACLPPPPPPSTWWCVIRPGSTNIECFYTPLTQAEMLSSGYSVKSGPHATLAVCQSSCVPPPPPVSLWWCVIKPSGTDRECFFTSLTHAELLAAGYTVYGTSYATLALCQADCVPPPPPVPLFWCVVKPPGTPSRCISSTDSQSSLQLQGFEIKAGPFFSEEQCTLLPCPPIPPPPPPLETLAFYCIQCGGQPRQCKLIPEPPSPIDPVTGTLCKVISGPFATAQDCEAACLEPPPPAEAFVCICSAEGTDKKCWSAMIVPPPGWDVCGGPYLSEDECIKVCKQPPPPPPPIPVWWCIQGFNSFYCLQGVAGVQPQGAVSGPYSTQRECQDACGFPPHPPPSGPPTPGVPPSGPPTPGFPPFPSQECCPPPPGSLAAAAEASTWRCWRSKNGQQYVTGPGEGPHNCGDTLLGEFSSLGDALSHCATQCAGSDDSQQSGQAPIPSNNTDNPWDDPEHCHELDRQMRSQPQDIKCELAKSLGFLDADGKVAVWPGFSDLNWVGQAIQLFVNSFIGNGLCRLEDIYRAFTSANKCVGAHQTNNDGKIALLHWMERLLGFDLGRLTQPIKYEQNYLCPYVLPTADAATGAYLRDTITYDQWTCWIKANGVLYTPATRLLEAARTRFDAEDSTRLWLRKILTDDQHAKSIRELGFLRDSDVTNVRELAKQYPPYSDIIRLMVRDTADDTIVDWPDSDKIWKQKYTGSLQQWGQFQGIPDEVAKLLWRAHWIIPSPGQLFEFWHRERQRGDTLAETPLGQSISAALLQQDILPRWIPHFENASYHVLGRRDIGRMYQVGVLDRNAMDAAWIKYGYSDDAANAVTEYHVRNTRLTLRSHSAVRSYISFGLSRAQATQELIDYGSTQEDINWVLDWAIGRVRSASRQKCVSGTKRRYTTGDLTAAEASAALLGLGLDADQVEIAITTWDCEITARGKTVTASQLCQWLGDGLISGNNMIDRLVRLGWPANDAANIVASCEQRIQTRLDREAAKQRKQAISDAKAAEKELEKIAKELQKQRDKIARALLVRQQKQEQRDKAIEVAAKKLAVKCGSDITVTVLLVREAIDAGRTVNGLTLTEAVTAATLAADDKGITSCQSYLTIAAGYSLGMVEAGQLSENGQSVTTSDSGNGQKKS